MGKYDNGVLGGIENLAILMREECDVYHYSLNPEFTKVSYDSCPLEIGASITPTTGYIEIIAINESSNDVQVVVKYCDYLGKTNKAYFSLGQEIKFGIMSEDDHTPDNYYILIVIYLLHPRNMLSKELKNMKKILSITI